MMMVFSIMRHPVFTSALACVLLLPGCVLPVLPYEFADDPPGEHILRIGHLSDPQLVDDESPARVVRMANLFGGAWRPQDAYLPHALDAMVRTVNARHEAALERGERGVDFVVITGDQTDLAQYNALRWFMDIMDGRWVVPDSGELDGVFRDVPPELNPKLGFQAAGLHPDIPWYTVHGNHDSLAVGNFALDTRPFNPEEWEAPMLPPVAALAGLHEYDRKLNALQPTSDWSPAVIRGDEDSADPDNNFQLRREVRQSGALVPDPRRRFTTVQDFVLEHFNSTTKPVGHGFTQRNIETGKGYYVAHPVPGKNIRLIVLNTVPERPPFGYPAFYGVMTREQFSTFLQPMITAARNSGEQVIIASHHPSGDFGLPYPGDTVSAEEFRSFLASQPNILVHLAGHSHRNAVRLIPGRYPYVEIETSGIIDYPQEGRIVDVYYDKETRTYHLQSTMIHHLESPTPLSLAAYTRSLFDGGHVSAKEMETTAETKETLQKLYETEYDMPDIKAFPRRPSASERFGTAYDRNVRIALPR